MCSSDLPGTGNCTLTMNSSRDVVAEFIAIKQLAVSKSGNGSGAVSASVSGASDTDLACGISCGTTKQKEYDVDTEVTLTAAPRSASPGSNSRFLGWKKADGSSYPGCETGESCVVSMSEARTLVASFGAVKPLNVQIQNVSGGQGSVTSSTNWAAASVACGHAFNVEVCDLEYDLNDEVTLTAVAEPGSVFAGWEDISGVGTTPTFADFTLGVVQSSSVLTRAEVAALSSCITTTCTVTMLGSTTIQATFQPAADPTPTPTPTPTPAGAVCEYDPADSLTGDAPLTIHFIGANSTGDIADFAWDFGDMVGTASTGDATYTYTDPGTYTATLTVTGTDAGTDDCTLTVTVTDPGPSPTPTPTPAGAVCEYDPADSLTGDAPLTIHFIGANSTEIGRAHV